MSERNCYKLFDVIDIIGGGTPKTSNEEYWNGEISWLSVVDFNNNHKYVLKTEKHITELGLKESSTKMLSKGDIIISARGTVGVIAILGKEMTFNQSCYGIKAKIEFTFNDFIYYFLKYSVSNFIQIAHGGVFDTITKDTFKEIEIDLPSLPEQKAIASVLSSLDDKIDLLNRQNETLEKMAETLFRKWFVESYKKYQSEGIITDEFQLETFLKWISETVGGEWGKEVMDNDFSKAAICLRGTDIADLNNGLAEKAPLRFVKPKKFENIEPQNGDILIEISGGTETQSTGRTTYINDEVRSLFDYELVFSNFCRLIKIKDFKYSYFVYSYLQYLYNQDEFFNLENGSSGIKNLDYKTLLFDLKFPMPSEDLVLNFHDAVEPLFKKINKNKLQIKSLSKLRDTLLPKLMSGEVRVKLD